MGTEQTRTGVVTEVLMIWRIAKNWWIPKRGYRDRRGAEKTSEFLLTSTGLSLDIDLARCRQSMMEQEPLKISTFEGGKAKERYGIVNDLKNTDAGWRVTMRRRAAS